MLGSGDEDRTVDSSAIRIAFKGHATKGKCEPINWDDFFQHFEEAGLCFVYRERTSNGKLSHQSRLIRGRNSLLEQRQNEIRI